MGRQSSYERTARHLSCVHGRAHDAAERGLHACFEDFGEKLIAEALTILNCQMSSTVPRQNPPEGKVTEIMVPSRSRGGIVIEAGWVVQ